jgi:hypothetical protein
MCRRKLSAYRIEVDRQKAEAADLKLAEKAAEEQAMAEEVREAASAAKASEAGQDATASLVELYDEYGQRQSSRFQQVRHAAEHPSTYT